MQCLISVDVEAGGPVPGLFPLLSIGACSVADPTLTFYVELKPRPAGRFDEAAVRVGWPQRPAAETLSELESDGCEPAEAFRRFAVWVGSVAQGRRAVYVGFNAAFDWMFTHHGFVAAGMADPFGIAPLDIKSYWAGVSGCAWRDTSKSRLPGHLTRDLPPFDHRADSDAVWQARLFNAMEAERAR